MVMIVNGVQWSPRFPRLLTKENMREIYVNEPNPFLRVIADIACDIEGSIEFTVKSTTSENPVYVYEPLTDRIIDGFAGKGPIVLAVDKLAADLPLEASKSFAENRSGNDICGLRIRADMLQHLTLIGGIYRDDNRTQIGHTPPGTNPILAIG